MVHLAGIHWRDWRRQVGVIGRKYIDVNTAYGDDGAALTAALGVEEVPYGELLLGVEAVNRARLERGADPLI